MQLSAAPIRSDRELFEEILETVRALARRPTLELEAPTSQPQEAKNIANLISDVYRPGTLVRHSEWGLGVIQKREMGGGRTTLTIIFRDMGRKVVDPKAVKLEMVSEASA